MFFGNYTHKCIKHTTHTHTHTHVYKATKKADIEQIYACNIEIKSSCGIQSYALENPLK